MLPQIWHLATQSIMLLINVTTPIMAVIAGIGLVVGITQTLVQIQDGSLAVIAKLVGIVAIILIFGPWVLHVLGTFMQQQFTPVTW